MISRCTSLQQTRWSLLWLAWGGAGAFPSGSSCVFLLLPRTMGTLGNWPISNLFKNFPLYHHQHNLWRLRMLCKLMGVTTGHSRAFFFTQKTREIFSFFLFGKMIFWLWKGSIPGRSHLSIRPICWACFCRPKKWPGQWAECDSCWWLFLEMGQLCWLCLDSGGDNQVPDWGKLLKGWVWICMWFSKLFLFQNEGFGKCSLTFGPFYLFTA